MIRIYHINKTLKKEGWYKNGNRCRVKDKPTTIIYDMEGRKIEEYWENASSLHRVNGDKPAIKYNKVGNIVEEEWYMKNKQFRKPSHIKYDV